MRQPLAHIIYTQRLTDDDLGNLDGIDYGAHIFQPFVESEYAVRLTVVGQRFLAVRIDAGSDRARTDWRSDYDNLTYQIIDIPPDTKVAVAAYMKLSGLNYGAFDLLVRADGSMVTLEINPERQLPPDRGRDRAADQCIDRHILDRRRSLVVTVDEEDVARRLDTLAEELVEFGNLRTPA